MAEPLLNVAAIRPRTQTNGPGWRAAVWVQGCTIGCAGCFNPQTHPHDAKRLWQPEKLAEFLVTEEVEGITILGGEPFEQAATCARLAVRARELGASVVTYSGYSWPFLRKSALPEVQALLAASDLLFAGPYVAARRNDGAGWHGSTNQQAVFLTDRYDRRALDEAEAAPIVEGWADGGALVWSGIPTEEDVSAIHHVAESTSAGLLLSGGLSRDEQPGSEGKGT